MESLLASTKKDYLHGNKIYYPDKRVCYRIFLCIFVFLLCILVLLHCSNLDASDKISSTPILIREDANSNLLNNCCESAFTDASSNGRPALHGLGTTFIKGSMSMDELVVAHVAENTSMQELKLFLRTFYLSGLAARADIVLLFTSDVFPTAMDNIIHKELEHLCKLYPQEKVSKYDDKNFLFNAFNSTNYATPMPYIATIWGHYPNDSNQFDKRIELDDSLVKFCLGSIVGFSIAELNPENSFEGFLDNPPLELRRWACYELLLGKVKHEFKQVLLSGVSGVLIMGDPLAMAREKMGLYLSLEDVTWGSSSKLTSDDGEDEVGSFEEMREVNESNLGGLEGAKKGRAAIVSRAPTLDSYAGKDMKDGLDMNAEEDIGSLTASGQISWKLDAQQRRELSSYAEHGIKSIGAKSGSAYGKSLRKNSGAVKQTNIMKKGGMHKRVRRRPKRRGYGGGGLYEQVYGRVLDDVEKKKMLVNSAAIVGGIQNVQKLANAMVSEIVRVAMHRRSREAFPDNMLLSHLVHKSSIKITIAEGDLQLMNNSESFVHSLMGSHQPSLFFRGHTRYPYSMISEGQQGKTRLWNYVTNFIHHNMCLSSSHAELYDDCLL